jgi:hypothetical protein
MSDSILREYSIRVELSFVFYDVVQVTATSEEEAKELAIQDAQCDWSKAVHTGASAFVITREGA